MTPERARTILRFAEVLASRPGLVGGDDVATLSDLGYVSQNGDQKIRVPWTTEQLRTVGEFFASAVVTDAALVWDGLVEASLADWYDEIPGSLSTICQDTGMDIGSFLLRYLLGHAKGELRAENSEMHVRTLGHVIDTTFWDALDNAARFFEYHHEHPVGTSWGIHCAMICLINYFPNAVDELIDGLVPIGQKAQAVLSALAAALTVSIRRANEALLSAFAELRNNFARALSAVAKWNQTRREMSHWPSFELYVKKYSMAEQQEILARALYDLRVEANRAKSNGKGIEQPIAEQIIRLLLSGFKDETTIEWILHLVPGFSGPINGSWAGSTHHTILAPLTESGKLPPDAPFQIWNSILADKKPNDFYAGTDFELIQVWGATFWDAKDIQQLAVGQEAVKRIRRATAALYEPFLASRNYDRWREAADTVLIWMLRLWAILRKQGVAKTAVGLELLAQNVLRVVDGEALVSSAFGELQQASQQVWAEFRALATEGEGG